ncbi:hypothetical protein QBC39DRAFT_297050 [Podospora conica]|nr:hypothetical protein QBC39DRAFT_297050 [Schizothecium conicum]
MSATIRKAATLAGLFLLSIARPSLANTEKDIFLGPDPVPIPLAHPTLSDLHIDTLTPASSSLRTRLAASFPSPSHPKGEPAWLILDDLTPGQRYEVRVCWAATQPTSFRVNTHQLAKVFETPELITSLSTYSTARQPTEDENRPPTPRRHDREERHASVLFLEILAAADYFTTNATLMRNPPPVLVDIILDPFLLNILPRSLLPTVGYIIAVAAVAYFAARYVVAKLDRIVASSTNAPTKKMQ